MATKAPAKKAAPAKAKPKSAPEDPSLVLQAKIVAKREELAALEQELRDLAEEMRDPAR